MKRLLFILDGLPESSRTKTTMEMARTPHLNTLSGEGTLAFLDLQPESGLEAERSSSPPSSERGILRLLGFPKEAPIPPRATLLSCLFPPEKPNVKGGMALLLNPARFEPDGVLSDYVGDGASINWLWSFFAQVPPGKSYFDRESGLRVFPLRDGRDKHILRLLLHLPRHILPLFTEGILLPPEAGRRYPEIPIAGWVRDKIGPTMDVSGHLNGCWPWGAGPWHNEGPSRKRRASSGTMISGAHIARAIGAFLGFSTPSVPGATGDVDTDLRSKMNLAKVALAAGGERVVVHLEGFDLASHRKNRSEKQNFLERFDQEIGKDLLRLLEKGEVDEIHFTSDHRSSPETGQHEPGPVPVLSVFGKIFSGHRTGRENREKEPSDCGEARESHSRFTEAHAEKHTRWTIDHWQRMWQDH